MEKHHSCLNTRAIIEYFQETMPAAVPELYAGLGSEIAALPNPHEFLTEINNWVSSDVVIQMFDNARRITGNDNIAFDIGFQSAARKKLGYVQRIIMFAHKNPRRTLQLVQAINDKFNKNKTIEVLETGRDHASIRLHWFEHIPAIIDFCRFNQGIYSGIPTIWDLPAARVFESKCFFRGDSYCEYHLQWEKKPLFRTSILKWVAPWSILKSTITELETDKELLKKKFNEIHRLNMQLKEQFDQLLCLQQTSTAALSLLHLEEILQVGLQLLIKFTKLDRASIFLFHEKEEVMELRHTAGIDAALLDRVRGYRIAISPGNHILAETFLDGHTTVIPDTTHLPFIPPDPLLKSLHPRGCILAPLKVHHKVIGVILADRRQPGAAITEADKEFVMSFANQMAIALENAKLYQEVEASERKYRGLVENAHEGIWIVDAEGAINFANRRMKEIAGSKTLTGKNIREFLDASNLKLMNKVLSHNREGKVAQTELEITSKTRGQVAVSLSSVPIMEPGGFRGTFAMFSDISEKKEMERQLLQQQKMDAIGTLAGGIAHNFNNILMNIMGLTGLILADTGVSDPGYGDLKLIEQEVIKGSALTKQLLSFGRGGKFSRQPINLNLLLDKTARLFCRTRSEITISKQLATNLPAVEVDPSQMEQVLLNLLVNSWQAMSGKGEMTLTTKAVTLTEDFCQPYGRPGGNYVHIALTDSGIGMDEPTAARIFEPFFTTKETGQGTGLGLAAAYAIIKNHQGIIKVDSHPGRGTTFHIYLPVSEKPAVTEEPVSSKVVKGVGTILLVDDEEGIRTVGRRILEQLGYEVLVAANGPGAVEIYRENQAQIQLVILDLIMPGMAGSEVYGKLKEINPSAKVLLSSGYGINGEAQKMVDAGALGFIQKPYRLDELSQQIAAILRPRGKRRSLQEAGEGPGADPSPPLSGI